MPRMSPCGLVENPIGRMPCSSNRSINPVCLFRPGSDYCAEYISEWAKNQSSSFKQAFLVLLLTTKDVLDFVEFLFQYF